MSRTVKTPDGQTHILANAVSDEDVASFLSQMEGDTSAFAAPADAAGAGLKPPGQNYNPSWVAAGLRGTMSGGAALLGARFGGGQGARAGAGLGMAAAQGVIESFPGYFGQQGATQDMPKRLLNQAALGVATETGGQVLAKGVGAYGNWMKRETVGPSGALQQQFPETMDYIRSRNLKIGDVHGKGGSQEADALVGSSAKKAKGLLRNNQTTYNVRQLAQREIDAAEKAHGRALNQTERMGIVKSTRDEVRRLMGQRPGNLPFNRNVLTAREMGQLAQLAGKEGRVTAAQVRAGNAPTSNPNLISNISKSARELRNQTPGVKQAVAETKAAMGARRALRVAETTRRPSGLPLPLKLGEYPLHIPLPSSVSDWTADALRSRATGFGVGQLPRAAVGAYQGSQIPSAYHQQPSGLPDSSEANPDSVVYHPRMKR